MYVYKMLKTYLFKNYLVISLLFVIVDSIYLSLVSGYFNNQIMLIQGSKLVLKPFSTFLCYIFLTFGISYFILLLKFTPQQSFWLGLYVYGVYETTNHAILRNWKWSTVVMDTVWGGVLFSLVTYLHSKMKKLI